MHDRDLAVFVARLDRRASAPVPSFPSRVNWAAATRKSTPGSPTPGCWPNLIRVGVALARDLQSRPALAPTTTPSAVSPAWSGEAGLATEATPGQHSAGGGLGLSNFFRSPQERNHRPCRGVTSRPQEPGISNARSNEHLGPSTWTLQACGRPLPMACRHSGPFRTEAARSSALLHSFFYCWLRHPRSARKDE